MTSRHAFGVVGLIALLCALSGVGCVDVVTFEYEEYVQPLGDDREMAVGTYPAWFPSESVSLAPLYVRLHPDEYVALQFHVRDRNGSGNAGPRIESVHVHRLAYRLDGGPETVALRDFRDGFWMQQTGTYSDRTKNGIHYRAHSLLHVTADLSVNGERFSIGGYARPPAFLPLSDRSLLPGWIAANCGATHSKFITRFVCLAECLGMCASKRRRRVATFGTRVESLDSPVKPELTRHSHAADKVCTFSIAWIVLAPGTKPLRFTVTRTNPQATAALNLQFNTESETATSGSDFQAAAGQIILQPTQSSATITVNVIGDTAVENVELLRLKVSESASTIPPQIALGAIFDDDAVQPPPQGSIAIPLDALAVEPATGESEARLAVRLARPATEALSFTFALRPGATATAGQDFVGPSSGQLEFAVGDLVKEIPFRILADDRVEGREIVAYSITPPQGVVLQRNFVTLSIVDRPTGQPPAPVSAFIVPCRPFVREDDPNARLLVKRVGDTSGALSINFATQDGNAVAGSDYTSTTGVLNWVAGNSEFKRVDVPIIDDQVVETPERFVVRLTDSNGQPFPGRSIAPIIILDSTDQIFLEDFDELCSSGSVFDNTGISE